MGFILNYNGFIMVVYIIYKLASLLLGIIPFGFGSLFLMNLVVLFVFVIKQSLRMNWMLLRLSLAY